MRRKRPHQTSASHVRGNLKAQGLLVTEDKFVFSTSATTKNRSNLYISDRAGCFRAPSMSEGMTTYGDNAYLLFGSGAQVYEHKTTNPVKKHHRAKTSKLTSDRP